jgi:hypothetical protein
MATFSVMLFVILFVAFVLPHCFPDTKVPEPVIKIVEVEIKRPARKKKHR